MVRGALEAVAKSWPNFPKSLATIISGLSRGMHDPRGRPDVPRETSVVARSPAKSNANTSSENAESGSEQLDAELAHLPKTDLGNAERFAKRLHNQLLWCDRGGWLRWDGTRFTHNGAEAAVKRAEHLVARSIQHEAEWLRAGGDDAIAFVKYKGSKHEEAVMQSDELASAASR
jgi:putative DNA primase/helicase